MILKNGQMEKEKHYKSTLARVERIKKITSEHYEAGNHARSYKAVWRRWINPEFKIHYKTYLRLLGIHEDLTPATPALPSLFDEL